MAEAQPSSTPPAGNIKEPPGSASPRVSESVIQQSKQQPTCAMSPTPPCLIQTCSKAMAGSLQSNISKIPHYGMIVPRALKCSQGAILVTMQAPVCTKVNLELEARSPKAMSMGSCQPLGRSAQPKRYAPAWELEETGRSGLGLVKSNTPSN